MNDDLFILLSSTLTFGVPLALAVRELWALRRDEGRGRGGDGRRERDPAPHTPPAPAPGGIGRPLPDCLIPKPLPASAFRRREVEHA